jgi:Ca2+-binding RTX toxin-like protein
LSLESLESRSLLAGISVVQSDGTTLVNESGTTDTLAVSLTEKPTSSVVLNVSSSDTGEATVAPTTLTFTPDNWNTAQTVTVTGVDDFVLDGNQSSTIKISVDDTSSDDAYDSVPDQTVPVTTVDNEAPGTATLAPNPNVPGTQALVVTGTSKSDHINVALDGSGNLVVTLKGQQIGSFAATGVSLIVINGLGGNDHITIGSGLNIAAEINGDAGNDHISGGGGNDVLTGGPGNDHINGGGGDDLIRGDAGNDKLEGEAGNDIVLGGAGNDNLSGGDGRDMLIGGAGNDQLNGGANDDILIGGTTSFDQNDQALESLLREWTSGRNFADRMTNLSQGTGDILHGTGFMLVQGTTVFNAGHDKLTGGSGDNLLFPLAVGNNHGNSAASHGLAKAKGHDK